MGSYLDGASPYGVLDMAGNVWEWTSSLWGADWRKPDFDYPYRLDDGRENLEAGGNILRVVRGGSFDLNQYLVRCARRVRHAPYFGYDLDGCRVALSPI